MVRFRHVHRPAVAVRRLLVRRPWIYWLLVAAVAAAIAAGVLERIDRVDAERDAWGRTRVVWVATEAVGVGDPIRAERRRVPTALAPADAVDPIEDAAARQRIGVGEIVTRADVTVGDRPQALVPEGWLAVPLVESPRSGAIVGDRVHVVSDGLVVTPDATVVALLDEVTLVAVPAGVAPLVAAAAEAGSSTLLLAP